MIEENDDDFKDVDTYHHVSTLLKALTQERALMIFLMFNGHSEVVYAIARKAARIALVLLEQYGSQELVKNQLRGDSEVRAAIRREYVRKGYIVK